MGLAKPDKKVSAMTDEERRAFAAKVVEAMRAQRDAAREEG